MKKINIFTQVFCMLAGLLILPIIASADDGSFGGAIGGAPVTGPYVSELSGLDQVMTNWTNKYGFQAAVIAVVKDKKLIYERGYGYADSGLTKEILPSARMRLATNSVSLTKRALRQLIAEGTLASNALVYQVLNLAPIGGKYADPSMQQITIQHLLDDNSCLIDHAPSVKQIGINMMLGRNATLAESIKYLWSQPSTIVPSCTVGSTGSGSHYAMEIAAQIIAKAMYPSLNDADPTAAGFWYGYYVDLHVGAPISASFTQANNLASQAWPTEIWYKSTLNCDPEWNRNWTSGQPQVSCAYAIDFFARPGSGTIVASARDVARYFVQFFHNGQPKPTSLSGITWLGVGYGTLPGTSSITVDQVMPDGTSRSFVVLANMQNESITPDTSFDEIKNNVTAYLDSITTWPTTDLFVDYRIKNRWTGQYVQIKRPNGKIQYGPLDTSSDALKWQLQLTSEGYYRLINRQTGDVIASLVLVMTIWRIRARLH